MRSRALQALGAAAAVGAGALAYGSVVERNWFALRRFEVPVLAAGLPPLRILHISDVHLTPRRHLLMSWLRSLDALEPDLVVNTGDSIGHPQAVEPFLEALGPLLDRPGVFVYGSNDLYSPKPRNPARYLWETSARVHRPPTAGAASPPRALRSRPERGARSSDPERPAEIAFETPLPQ